MPDYPISKQQRIITALKEHLEGINPSNDDPVWALHGLPPLPYSTDLRGKVFVGKTTIGTEIGMPCLSILESPRPVEGVYAGENGYASKDDWGLMLQGFSENDTKNPTLPAYEFKAMVELRLSRLILMKSGKPAFPSEYLLGNLLVNLRIPLGVVRPPEEKVSPTAFFYIPLAAEITSDPTNPYAD